ncbi:MAG: hypothetical protein K5663_11685 [Clostridiales bacterium]|nr:hypothetical protein [Clostridiales bacterium]
MKKIIAIIVSLSLLISVCAFAEETEPDFAMFSGMEWSFLSGAGGWSTDMRILEDGSFRGEYHDSEMGETGDAYPYGTVYCCSFVGTMRFSGRVDEYSWNVVIDSLSVNEEIGTQSVSESLRFVITEPYGISDGDTMRLYRLGTPVSFLNEDMYIWAHLYTENGVKDALDTWFLCSEKNESGFVGEKLDYGSGMEDPWLEMSADELSEASGLHFAVPQGAQDVTCRYLPSEQLAEMQFSLFEDEFCARIQPAALEYGQLMNISDIFLPMENEEEITVGRCYGTIGQSQTGSEDFVELCLWYDAVPGIMYSLSVYSNDLDGLDLTAVAEQVYIPVQGDT